MQRTALTTLLILTMLLWVACTSSPDKTQYPDDEEILYIETDSLIAESN